MSCFICPVSKQRMCSGGCGACDDCPGDNPDKERGFNGLKGADYETV